MQERKVTAKIVCNATGIPKSTLSEWLTGRQPKLDESIVRLARFFGVSVERLICGEEPEEETCAKLIHQPAGKTGERYVEVLNLNGLYRLQLRIEKQLKGEEKK